MRSNKRTSCDLYVGNLDFKADDNDLFESVEPLLNESGIRLETATVPRRKDGNRGYGFIELSWNKNAPIDPEDICTRLSGMFKVNNRLVYVCETNDTSNTSTTASDRSDSDNDTSSVSSAASDRPCPEPVHNLAYLAAMIPPCKPHNPGYDSDGESNGWYDD